jgi:hypothetical protein
LGYEETMTKYDYLIVENPQSGLPQTEYDLISSYAVKGWRLISTSVYDTHREDWAGEPLVFVRYYFEKPAPNSPEVLF